MKLTIVLLALVGLVAAADVPLTSKAPIADHAFLAKQKFLLEIVYRVEDPLMLEDYLKLGHSLSYDQAHYSHFDHHMKVFYESYKQGALLPRGEFFGALVKSHHKQALGLFNYFYYAKDWETFQQNVAWARIHVNEGMFVYALTLAVIHRDDFKGLMLPSIYEIFPQYFFNSKLIYAAEKFDWNTWSKYMQYEKELHDVYHKNSMYHSNDYFYMKDFKTYQWWKLMGLGEQWYANEKSFPLRENWNEFISNDKYMSLMKGINIFWHPVDYTRDIQNLNKHSVMSYFTEDLGWNAYWYYLNMDYAFFLDGKTFGLDKDRRGEWWLYNIDQILARYYMERLSHGLGEIPELSWNQAYEYGYDPALVSYNGVGYSYRVNYYQYESQGNLDMLNQINSAFKRIYDAIDIGYYTTYSGQKIDLRKAESIEYIGNYMQNNIDAFDKTFFNYWNMLTHMYLGYVDYNDNLVQPSISINFETMLRDPIMYILYKKIADVFYHFKYHLVPYTHEELLMQGVKIEDVEFTDLVTYFDWTDFDVSNLMNDKMVVDNGTLVWNKALYARQMRLNHKPFEFEMKVMSEKPQKVVISAFLGPKLDEYGSIISLKENRKNFIELDEFVYELTAGVNEIKRSSSEDLYWNIEDRTTYTELYQYVMAAYDGKYEMPLDISKPHCYFPDRLLLPKGWESGYPMQFFFYIAPYEGSVEESDNNDYTYYCGIGSGERHTDNKPFGYPLDRPIDEYEFLVPNMYFKDVMIYHNNTLKPYMWKEYKNMGHFDYDFVNTNNWN